MTDRSAEDDSTAVGLAVSFGAPRDRDIQATTGNVPPSGEAPPSVTPSTAPDSTPQASVERDAPVDAPACARQCSDALQYLLSCYPCCRPFPGPWAGITPSPDCRSTDCEPDELIPLLRERFVDCVLREANILVGPDATPQIHPSLRRDPEGLLIAIRDASGRHVVDLHTPTGLLSASVASLYVVVTPAAESSAAGLPTDSADTGPGDSGDEEEGYDRDQFSDHTGQPGHGLDIVFATCCPQHAALFHSIGIATVLFRGFEGLTYPQWLELERWQPRIAAVPGCLSLVSPCDARNEPPATVEFPGKSPGGSESQPSDGQARDGQPVPVMPGDPPTAGTSHPGEMDQTGVSAADDPPSGVTRPAVPELLFVAGDLLGFSVDVPAQSLEVLDVLRVYEQSLRMDFGDWLEILPLTETDFDHLHCLLQFRSALPIFEWFNELRNGTRLKLATFWKQFTPAEPPPSLVEARRRLVEALCNQEGEMFYAQSRYRQLYDEYADAVERECVVPFLAKAQAEDSRNPVLGEAYRQLAAAARRMHLLEPFLSVERIPPGLQRGLGLGQRSVEQCYDTWKRHFVDIYSKFFQKHKSP